MKHPASDPHDDALVSLLTKQKQTKRDSDKLQRCKSIKPILSRELDEQIHAAVAQYMNLHLWNEWGMKFFRRQGTCILLQGPPGCGKTIIAHYLSSLLNKGVKEIDLGKFGSTTPGEGERTIEKIFSDAGDRHQTVFIDEADAILWDRSKAGADSMWMVSIIDKFLIEIARYRWLTILASNRAEILDSALERRILANIVVGKPEQAERLRIWKSKVPKQFPLQLSQVQLQDISDYKLTGAEIENAIIKETQLAILHKRKPNFDSLCNVAKSLQK